MCFGRRPRGVTGRLRIWVVLLVVAAASVGCGEAKTGVFAGDPDDESDSGSVSPRPTPPPPPFTVYVSNQSFEEPTVAIEITIDTDVVVDQDFDVEGQHNWITFTPDVPPGEHTLRAVSNTGAEFTVEFTLVEGQPRWAVVDYWYYPDDGPRKFTFRISDEPIAFA